MTFDEIERQLPWGLHDADLDRLEIDWMTARAVLDIRVKMTKKQDIDRPGRLTVSGLVFCSVDPPVIDPVRGCEVRPSTGLSIDTGEGAGDAEAGASLPIQPDGTFLQWI